MDTIKRISECPNCGANVLSVDPTSLTHNKCPYCGFELYNHSEEIYNERIEDVKQAKNKFLKLQIILVIAGLIIAVIAAIFVINRTVYRNSNQYFLDASDDVTKKMEKAYAKEDWDTLFDLTIMNADKGLTSPYYFSFKSAWVLYHYVPLFDEAYKNNDSDGMKEAFREIRYDYENRAQLEKTNTQLRDIGADDAYKFVPEIEEDLKAEYDREMKIMEEKGLLN